MRRLVNRHQLRDKGFGPALGPAAAHRVCDLFVGAGFDVFRSPSDWDVLPSEVVLQQQLIQGWAGAAAEVEPSEGSAAGGLGDGLSTCAGDVAGGGRARGRFGASSVSESPQSPGG